MTWYTGVLHVSLAISLRVVERMLDAGCLQLRCLAPWLASDKWNRTVTLIHPYISPTSFVDTPHHFSLPFQLFSELSGACNRICCPRWLHYIGYCLAWMTSNMSQVFYSRRAVLTRNFWVRLHHVA